LGATSGTGSRTGTYYTAPSDVVGESQVDDAATTVVGMGMVNTLRPKKSGSRLQSPSSRNSLSAYAFGSSNLLGQNPRPPPADPLPPLPVMHTLPEDQSPDPSFAKTTTRGPRARAHIRPSSALRVRADPHPQPSIARAGRSTHGIIDLGER